MKKFNIYVILALFLLCKLTVNGQQTVQGNVFGDDGNALPFANALLLNSEDSKLVRGAVTDLNGDYIIENIEAGEYIVTVSFVGYNTQSSKPFVLKPNSTFTVPTITISESVGLDEVTVRAKKPLYQQKIDRMVINVATSPLSAGTTALEVGVLRKQNLRPPWSGGSRTPGWRRTERKPTYEPCVPAPSKKIAPNEESE